MTMKNRKNEGGLRVKGHLKRAYNNSPLISIVTVVFNGEIFLEKTIQSVINQNYDNIEYVIIDGSSTDGTIDIIAKYEDKIDYWISEGDKGIYDAMNKGVELIRGDWVNFMNAGDLFHNNNTVESLFSDISTCNCLDVVYGDTEIDYGQFKRVQKAKDFHEIWKGMIFSHQSCFVKTEYHKINKYTLDYSIAGDFDFFYNMYKNGGRFRYVNSVVSIMIVEGLSDKNRYESIRQIHNIVNSHNLYFYFLYVDQFFRKFAKIILTKKSINAIKRSK
jgi:glycosyltransferase involved in cell wall biosynthesis